MRITKLILGNFRQLLDLNNHFFFPSIAIFGNNVNPYKHRNTPGSSA